ncbi:MAG: S8 family serine peptidase [Planctomycetes bacterium]|nr:S8 family serine peptidase [Planctomycetota bacterium]
MLSGRGMGRVLLCVAFAPTITASAQVVPDDPDFPLQWGLHNIGQVIAGQAGAAGADIDAPRAWSIHSGTSSVVVAIVATGVDPHPEFSDRLLPGRAMVGDLFDTRDTHTTGTHSAGIIGAASHNASGIAGIHARVRLLPVRVSEGVIGTEASAAAGIIWAVDQGADVVLVPLVFTVGTKALSEAVQYAVDHDVVVIAPTGNTGKNEIFYPAAFEGCLAVSATTNQDTLSPFSSYGLGVDLAAPGQDIWSTWPGGEYGYESGAAAASAFVAGVAALLRSYAPQLPASQVIQVLLDSSDDLGDPGPDIFFGAGRVNARSALELAPEPAIRFDLVGALPPTIPPGMAISFEIRIADAADRVDADTAVVFHRGSSESFSDDLLTPLGDGRFRVELPPSPCGSTLEYYFAAQGLDGTLVVDPLDAPTHVYRARVIVERMLFHDDFEQDRGWQTTATGGKQTRGHWTRVIPAGTSAQPGFDYSPNEDRYCYVTGQHFGGSEGLTDVDGGPVSLISPLILLDAPDAQISYARWFHWSGSGKEDFLTVELSRDDGDTWMLVETVATGDEWATHRFRLSDFPDVNGNELRVRFSTEDSPNDSLTEAAVDEFLVQALSCAAASGDADGDGDVDLDDHQTLVGCWRGPSLESVGSICARMDMHPDRRVDLLDFQVFQNRYTGSMD